MKLTKFPERCILLFKCSMQLTILCMCLLLCDLQFEPTLTMFAILQGKVVTF